PSNGQHGSFPFSLLEAGVGYCSDSDGCCQSGENCSESQNVLGPIGDYCSCALSACLGSVGNNRSSSLRVILCRASCEGRIGPPYRAREVCKRDSWSGLYQDKVCSPGKERRVLGD